MADSETVVTDDLDEFSNLLFQTKAPEAKPVEEKEVEEVSEIETPSATTDAPEHQGNESEAPEEEKVGDDAPADEDEKVEDDEEDKSFFKTKPRKSARERINELTRQAREAERRADALARELDESRVRRDTKEDKTPAASEDGAPNPDAKNEAGELLYPLGEFDPHYVRDLTRFTISKEYEAIKAQEAEDRRTEETRKAEEGIVETWKQKISETAERLPDLREKALGLEDTFRDIEPNYGKYLATTIMSLEYGPDVLNYLADNPAEARNIVASGATQATIALGRLEAKLSLASERDEKVEKGKIVTSAPEPAPRNKGSGGRAPVAADTDDLDAFEKVFFASKKR